MIKAFVWILAILSVTVTVFGLFYNLPITPWSSSQQARFSQIQLGSLGDMTANSYSVDGSSVNDAEGSELQLSVSKALDSPSEARQNPIIVGHIIDLDNSATWSTSKGTKPITVGKTIDPDDPLSWFYFSGEIGHRQGGIMSPDEPWTWSSSEASKLPAVGGAVDLEDPQTWSQSDAKPGRKIGGVMDPDTPSTWTLK